MIYPDVKTFPHTPGKEKSTISDSSQNNPPIKIKSQNDDDDEGSIETKAYSPEYGNFSVNLDIKSETSSIKQEATGSSDLSKIYQEARLVMHAIYKSDSGTSLDLNENYWRNIKSETQEESSNEIDTDSDTSMDNSDNASSSDSRTYDGKYIKTLTKIDPSIELDEDTIEYLHPGHTDSTQTDTNPDTPQTDRDTGSQSIGNDGVDINQEISVEPTLRTKQSRRRKSTDQSAFAQIVKLELFKPAPVHFCTDFTSTANATVSKYGRDVLRLGTFLQAVKVVQDSQLINTHPHPKPTRATLPSRHSFAGI
ncbi:hypothetical protein RF11_08135 [Thelohanellus kitauei]|uniref:Uncharacterized protein n=1 Tax=Thelohanellus kitauei TaxID=669202 RepID=A0A0C2IRY8_THEKT|nr:hypothetical protein RF11_08135 [Thelohanellus kitauei]